MTFLTVFSRQAGRTLLDILSANHLLKGPENANELINVVRKQNECKEFVLMERQRQFLQILRAVNSSTNLEASGQDFLPPKAVLASQAIKPLVKTYTRKTTKKSIFKTAPQQQPQHPQIGQVSHQHLLL